MEAEYQITSQAEVIDLSNSGAPVRAQEITFRSLPSGTIATVRVPIADFTAATAAAAIKARRDIIEAVHEL